MTIMFDYLMLFEFILNLNTKPQRIRVLLGLFWFQDNGREALDLTASPLRAPPVAPNNRPSHPPPMVIQGDFRKVSPILGQLVKVKFPNCIVIKHDKMETVSTYPSINQIFTSIWSKFWFLLRLKKLDLYYCVILYKMIMWLAFLLKTEIHIKNYVFSVIDLPNH